MDRSAPQPHNGPDSPGEPTIVGAAGRVLRVNVSPGGVPKEPVAGPVRVGRLGLEGDRHRADTVHGGPHRAVSLFAIEAIRRVAAEGHPISPGSTGENLTTEGIELATLEPGTRLAVGTELVLELSKPAMPCDTIVDSFRDRRSGRISILRHPLDSRVYARVVREGPVCAGDEIRVLPPEEGTEAAMHVLLDRIEAVERFSRVARWRAAAAAGYEIAFVDAGDLTYAASVALPGQAFNSANGLRSVPNLLGRVIGHFRQAGTVGWLSMNDAPWEGASPDFALVVHAGEASAVAATAGDVPAGIAVRTVPTGEVERWSATIVAANGMTGADAVAWARIFDRLAFEPGHRLVLAEVDGRPVGAAMLVTRRRVGLARSAAVLPEARGRGIQHALLRHRAALAAELGCDLVVAVAEADNVASRANIERAGLWPVWTRDVYRFDPAAHWEAAVAGAVRLAAGG